MLKASIALLVSVLLAGCAAYQTVHSGQASVGKLQVQTASDWTSINPQYLTDGGPRAVWTRDGTVLNYVLLYDGVQDGTTLFRKPDADADPYPAYRAAMSEAEVSELIADSIKRYAGANEVVVERVEPARFAGQPGFSGELSYTAKSELDYRSYFAGAVISSELYLIIYSAPRLHFFDKDIGRVRGIVASARITSS